MSENFRNTVSENALKCQNMVENIKCSTTFENYMQCSNDRECSKMLENVS